jgi:hypothetical protein
MDRTSGGVFAMIERINSQSITVWPAAKSSQQPKDLSLKVPEGQGQGAEYLFNPRLADKISRSRESLNSEMKILQEAEARKQQDAKQVEQEAESSGGFDTLASLKRSLTRMKSLLYQMASATGGNFEATEAIQRELADELRGYRRVFRGIDISVDQPEPDSRRKLDVAEQVRQAATDSSSTTDALNAVERAESDVEIALRTREEVTKEESRTAAALKTAEQNLAAAENTYYPQDILSRAREVAEMLQQQSGATSAQRSLKPDEVYKLLNFGQ